MSKRRQLAAQVRDEKNLPGPEDELSAGVRKHKDKKRWCKGKVGVEHTSVCVPYRGGISTVLGAETAKWRQLVCSKCGKILDYYYPFKGRGKKKPDWVTS